MRYQSTTAGSVTNLAKRVGRSEISMKTKTLLMLSSSIEFVTGLALIAAPGLVANLLLSAGLAPGGQATARVGGIALVSLAIACWPRGEGEHAQPIVALFLYNLLSAFYLGYLKIGGEFSSFLLLPASALHGLLALLFARPAYGNVIVNDPKVFPGE
jgi:hypothetical protein